MTTLHPGRGTRRFLMSRRELRARCERLDTENNNLICALVSTFGRLEAALGERDNFERAVKAAAVRNAELTEQMQREARVRTQMIAGNTALQAALVSARKAAAVQASQRPCPTEAATAPSAATGTVNLDGSPPELFNAMQQGWRATPTQAAFDSALTSRLERAPADHVVRSMKPPRTTVDPAALGRPGRRTFTVLPAPTVPDLPRNPPHSSLS